MSCRAVSLDLVKARRLGYVQSFGGSLELAKASPIPASAPPAGEPHVCSPGLVGLWVINLEEVGSVYIAPSLLKTSSLLCLLVSSIPPV